MPEQGTKPQQGTPMMGVDPTTGVARFIAVNSDGEIATGGGGGGGPVTNAGTFAVQVTSSASHPVTNAGTFAVQAALNAGANVIGKVDHTTTGISHGKKTVTTAGTDVVLAASTPAKWVTIQAYRANTKDIAVGGTGVDAAEATGDGVALAPGASITLSIDNLADVFIDATVSGEGVRFTYGT
jgi:hypothetical protein